MAEIRKSPEGAPIPNTESEHARKEREDALFEQNTVPMGEIRNWPTEAERIKLQADAEKIFQPEGPKTHTEANVELLEEIPEKDRPKAATMLISNPGNLTEPGAANELFNQYDALRNSRTVDEEASELKKAS
jgi:hypothetical protein